MKTPVALDGTLLKLTEAARRLGSQTRACAGQISADRKLPQPLGERTPGPAFMRTPITRAAGIAIIAMAFRHGLRERCAWLLWDLPAGG